VGIRGKSRPRPDVVISFQLDAMVCPWFDHQARDCTIRYKRPLVCRAYPIVQKSLDISCRFITQYASVENEKIELNPQTIKEEIAADDTILAYIKKSMTGQAALWCWSLEKRQWELVVRKEVGPETQTKEGLNQD
jgi:hypothetical protein